MRIHHTRGNGPHYAALRCVDCDKHVQWLSSGATHLLASMGVDVAIGYNKQAKSSMKHK